MKKYIIYFQLLLILFSCNNYETASSYRFDYNKNITQVFQLSLLNRDNKVLYIDTIGLICRRNNDTTQLEFTGLMKWEFMTYNEGKYIASKGREDYTTGTGVISTPALLLIHPPRHNYLTILEFNPYPYFEFTNKQELKQKWEWDLIIGTNWTIKPNYPITDDDTFYSRYINNGIKIINVLGKNRFCYEISAVNVSKYGKSYAKYYLDSSFEMVKFNSTAINDTIYDFTLISTIDHELFNINNTQKKTAIHTVEN